MPIKGEVIRKGRGHDIGAIAVKLIAKTSEESQRVGLIVHARPTVEQLVSSAPKYNAGVTAQSGDHRCCLTLQHAEVAVGIGIIVAGKHKLLPYHDSLSVTDLVKFLLAEGCSAPQTEDIHVRILGKLTKLLIGIGGDPSPENIRVNEIGSLHKYPSAVQLQRKGCRIAGLGKPLGSFAPGLRRSLTRRKPSVPLFLQFAFSTSQR